MLCLSCDGYWTISTCGHDSRHCPHHCAGAMRAAGYRPCVGLLGCLTTLRETQGPLPISQTAGGVLFPAPKPREPQGRQGALKGACRKCCSRGVSAKALVKALSPL